ncbi:MAG TPA: hypothetical protein VGB00_11075, partial [Pyrinomonadaceae bacterium]
LKTEASKFVKSDGANMGSGGSSTAHLVNRYLNVIKNSGYGSSGGGAAGSKGGGKGGGGGGFGRAAALTGQRLGGFLSRVADVGLTEALREFGLSDLIGKSAEDVINGITDAFTDPASSLDEEAARVALYELNKELLQECDTFEEIEESFMEVVDEPGIVKTIVDFFSRYIYRIFCRDFYEGWQKKAGADQAAQKLEDVKGYIFSSTRNRFTGETTNRNWAGNDGLRASEQILRDTIDIFEIA